MTFEEYLTGKKINHEAFNIAEPDLYQRWKIEFDQSHPNSFTAQKLYLINPVRRKYPLQQTTVEKIVPAETKAEVQNPPLLPDQPSATSQLKSGEEKPAPSPKPARPVFKPKPKLS